MQTQYIGTTAGSLLGAGLRYRLTLVADSGFYDGARFDSRARSVWDGLASSGLAFPATPLAVGPDDTATTFDIRTSQRASSAVSAELVRWVAERTGGTVHVARLEKLAAADSINDEAGRERATQTAEEERAAAQPTAIAGQFLSGVRTTTVALAVVAGAVLLIYFGRRPR